MNLRKGKTKSLLESSIDSALLAVEIYNKPRVSFRCESYITHMIMAWTRLFHAHFHNSIGDKYYYKEKNSRRYKMIDGERKAWELDTCIAKYGKLSDGVKSNLKFFIKLRNKIEHRCIEHDQIGIQIFGECQAMLYNYENELVKLFGEEYAVNENLAYSLQFSTIRQKGQIEANRQLLSSEIKELRTFINNYRTSLSEAVFNSQEYSIKLIQIPKIANTNRSDLAIEFVNWNSLSEEDRSNFQKLSAIIKDKVIRKEAINPGKLKPGEALKKINERIGQENRINQYDHKCILAILSIRPYKEFASMDNPYLTNVDYCHYDETHNDYVYQDSWVDFVVDKIDNGKLTKEMWTNSFKNRQTININSL